MRITGNHDSSFAGVGIKLKNQLRNKIQRNSVLLRLIELSQSAKIHDQIFNLRFAELNVS